LWPDEPRAQVVGRVGDESVTSLPTRGRSDYPNYNARIRSRRYGAIEARHQPRRNKIQRERERERERKREREREKERGREGRERRMEKKRWDDAGGEEDRDGRRRWMDRWIPKGGTER